jgi:hypothetical protein
MRLTKRPTTTASLALAPVSGTEAPKRRSTILFEAPSLLFEALLWFEAPTSCLLLLFDAQRDSCFCSHTRKRHRQEQEALRHCFGASMIRCFSHLAPRCLEQGQEQERPWSSASWLTSSCLIMVNLTNEILTIVLRVGLCLLKEGTVRKVVYVTL